MWGIIEFREEEHKQNLETLHNVKKEICEVIDKMERGAAFGERRGQYGSGTNERDYRAMEERRGGMNNRGGYGNHFPYPESYPQYPMYDERYRY